MEKPQLQTVREIPISNKKSSFETRRRRPLKSRTVDTLLHILSLCYDDSSHGSQSSDKGINSDSPLDCTDNIPNESQFQEKMFIVETQAILDTQEDGLYSKESVQHNHNIFGEKKDPSQKVNVNPSANFDIKNQDNYDMICSSPHLPTNEGVEEGQISGDFMDFMPESETKSVGEIDYVPRDSTSAKTGLKNDSNTIPLCTEAVENGGIDVAGVVSKTTRNLVDYSEIVVHAKSEEYAKKATLKINATKNHLVKDSGAQNNRKRQGSCTGEERRNKKPTKSVVPTTRPENVTLLSQHLEGASQDVVDASANKDAYNEKKKKRVCTKERKAKKKIKDRIKRAEKNRKLGIRRLKLQPVVKEKKVTYCRHYMNGRCHEGEKCKFSHDTTPLTKSKPCCHFARHACMKGDACPYDHQLAKYPCNNYQTKGSCNRGSDCMFSHEIQLIEDSLNESNKSKPEQEPLPNSSLKVEIKSCSVPIFVDITPKSTCPPKGINFLSQEKLPLESRPPKGISFLSQEKLPLESLPPKGISFLSQEKLSLESRPPKGISFLSQGKLPLESQPPKGISFLSQEKLSLESRPSPKVDSEVKDSSKTPPPIEDFEEKTNAPPVVHNSEKITKPPTVVPRGINFLSFGKKPGSDYSSGGYSFIISNGVEKSRLSDVVGEGLKSGSTVSVVNEVKVNLSTDKPNSSKKPMPMMSFISNTSQKALQSTLAFASELEFGVKSKV